MASIRRTPYGTWQARYRDTAGRQRGKTFKRKADALAFCAQVQHEVNSGNYLNPTRSNLRFSEWAGPWLNGQVQLSPASMRRYRTMLRLQLEPSLGSIPMSAITPVQIRSLIRSLTDDYAPLTVRNIYSLLSKILDDAVVDGVLAKSPCHGIPLPKKAPKHPRTYLTVKEVERLTEAMEPRFRPFVIIGAYMGLRWGEIAGLQRHNIEFESMRLSVTQAVGDGGGRHVLTTPKTNRSARTLAMPMIVADALTRHLHNYPSPHDLIFSSVRGSVVRYPDFYRYRWKPATRCAGLPNARFHELRHTHASWLIALGQPLKLVQERLGHASPTTTLETYSHLLPGADQHAAALLDEVARATYRQEPPAVVSLVVPDDEAAADCRIGGLTWGALWFGKKER